MNKLLREEKPWYPVPILGATSANTLQYAFAAYGNGYQGFSSLSNLFIGQWGARYLTNVAGVVTFQQLSGQNSSWLASQPVITFSGFTGADAIFNGPCYNTAYSTTPGYLTCTQIGR